MDSFTTINHNTRILHVSLRRRTALLIEGLQQEAVKNNKVEAHPEMLLLHFYTLVKLDGGMSCSPLFTHTVRSCMFEWHIAQQHSFVPRGRFDQLLSTTDLRLFVGQNSLRCVANVDRGHAKSTVCSSVDTATVH